MRLRPLFAILVLLGTLAPAPKYEANFCALKTLHKNTGKEWLAAPPTISFAHRFGRSYHL